jgi:S-adenosylmethionine:tRNA ribosyltransferase-isomerase
VVAERGETDLRLVFNLEGEDFDAALAEAGACRCRPISPPETRPRRPGPHRLPDRLCPPFRRRRRPHRQPAFRPWLLPALADRGVAFTEVTLHVGAGTFLPVKVEDVTTHRMHAEWGEVTAAAAAEINATRAAGGRVIPVGTTALRLIESAGAPGRMQPWEGRPTSSSTPASAFASPMR